jgi:dTDP-4-dehydrorhamnose reductase
VADTRGVPTSAELIADVTALALARLLAPGAAPAGGLYHLVPAGITTWHEYACVLLELAQAAGMALRAGPGRVAPVPASAFPAAAQRPLNSCLDTQHLQADFGLQLPDWRWHVARFVDAVAREDRGAAA